MLKTKVKVSKITNLSEARYCAAMGVDLLSFPASRIDPKTFVEIIGWVAGPKFGIEADLTTIDRMNEYAMDFIQLNHEYLDRIAKDKVTIPQLHLNEWSSAKAKLIARKSHILFLELAVAPLNEKEELLLEEIGNDFDVLLPISNTDEIDRILKWSVAGISLEGGAEQRPGLKEYPLADFLEKLENE